MKTRQTYQALSVKVPSALFIRVKKESKSTGVKMQIMAIIGLKLFLKNSKKNKLRID
jgi:hypothetical protein